MDKYKIGDLIFSWDSPDYKLNKGQFFEKFRVDSTDASEEIRFKGVLEAIENYAENEKLEANYVYELYKIGSETFYIYHWSKNRFAFGFWPERVGVGKENVVYFNPELKEDLPITTDWLFGLIGLHKAFLQKGKPILHASYIDFNGQAILFTAPSQTGKSTQADLWKKYMNAEIVNGDRVLLGMKNGQWYAYGYPGCGSSKICLNRTLPVRAIVILEQGAENEVLPVSLTDSVRGLMSAIEVYKWDLDELNLSFRLAQDIAGGVEVLKLKCRPDKDAVETLKNFLEGN